MCSFLKKLNQLIQLPEGHSRFYTAFWTGASAGIASLVGIVTFFAGYFFNTGIPKLLVGLASLTAGWISFKLFRIIIALAQKGLVKIPVFVVSLLGGSFITLLLAREFRFGLPSIIFYPSVLLTMLCFVLIAGYGWALFKRTSHDVRKHRVLIIACLVTLSAGLYFFVQKGTDPYPIEFEPTPAPLLSAKGITNPGERGSYRFHYFTYGSGTDQRGSEFGKEVNYKTPNVDASLLLPEWKDFKAKWRERFWGFGVKTFPLNGRVWMPQGDGKFPMILIVHGNHGMEDYSDGGYDYLGELLASRGFITLSVDENFINATWSGDFMGKEMPTRAWLLLKHLELWKTWSKDPQSPFYNKVDIDNVVLAGHSRGGEAISIAASYNQLDYFPDNANEKFNFHFGIKGLVSIAQIDKRYTRRINLKDVNYLSLHGSYDSDEPTFFGYRQYQRIKFTDSAFYFKSGVYIHRANHGQFNSSWGSFDSGPPQRWLLNVKPLIPMEDQQRIAKVYIGAFAEVVLHNNKNYLPLFMNSAGGADWLPKATLLNTYADSYAELLANFEEDIDVTSGSADGVTLQGQHLNVWREETILFRDQETQGTNGVILGWNTDEDSLKKTPMYGVSFQNPLVLDSNQSVLITIAPGDQSELKSKKKFDKKAKESPINFTLQLTDSLGHQTKLDLNAIKKLTPRLKVQYEKLDLLQESYGNTWEPEFETIEFPLARFSNLEALKNIKQIKFVFDKTHQGVIIIDEINIEKKLFR